MAGENDGFSVTSLTVPLVLLPLMIGGSWGSFEIYDSLVTEVELEKRLNSIDRALDRILAQQIEAELDQQHASRCNGYAGNEDTIRRMEAEYFRLQGRPYARKSCDYFKRTQGERARSLQADPFQRKREYQQTQSAPLSTDRKAVLT